MEKKKPHHHPPLLGIALLNHLNNNTSTKPLSELFDVTYLTPYIHTFIVKADDVLASSPRLWDLLGVEVIAFVIYDDERREVLAVNLPDRLHAQLGILQHFHFRHAVLR